MTDSPAPRPDVPMTYSRLFAGIALGAFFACAIWAATWAAGYGRDLHTMRVVALAASRLARRCFVVGRTGNGRRESSPSRRGSCSDRLFGGASRPGSAG